MDESTGDGSQIIRLGSGGSATGASYPTSTSPPPPPSSSGAPRPPRDPFARSRFLPSKRVALVAVLLVLVGAGGWYAVHTTKQRSQERAWEKQAAGYRAAAKTAESAMAGFAFPASAHIVPFTHRCFIDAVCGTTRAAPDGAMSAVEASLAARDVEVVDRKCRSSKDRPRLVTRCHATMKLHGTDIGQIEIFVNPRLRDAFGSPTTVWVSVVSRDTGANVIATPAPAMPSDPTKVTVLPPDLMAEARCTKPVAEGCLMYVIDSAIHAKPGVTWKRSGRYAVAHGWDAGGDCPLGPEHSCTFDATRDTADGGVAMTATFRPAPTELLVHAEIAALDGSVPSGSAATSTGRAGHNGT